MGLINRFGIGIFVAIASVALAIATTVAADDASVAKGVVYHDVNENGKFDEGDKPLAGMRVSNGEQIVKTDMGGRYELPIDDDATIFVIKSRDWRTPLNTAFLPQFYYTHKPAGSPDDGFRFKGVEPTGPLPESIDFPLYPQKEPDQFSAILFGDPQPRDEKEVDYIQHDVIEELIGTKASLGVTLGDIVFDDLRVFDSLNKSIALIGIPWYNVIGNHDINFRADSDEHSDETFERIYGPAYYSFDHGPVHFIVLDNVYWHKPDDAPNKTYRCRLGKMQLAFVKNDLALIPKDQLVVLLMHIPITGMDDREAVYRMIEDRPFCISISGHTHTHEHHFLTKKDGWRGKKPHHHIVNVTVSGSWWSGKPDARGIPHTIMRDGGPNGYSIISFDGMNYHLDYKAASRSKDHQMRVTAPQTASLAKLPATHVYANVFNGSEKTTVEMRLSSDDEWQKMTKTEGEFDPTFMRLKKEEQSVPDDAWRKLGGGTRPSTHLWKAKLPKVKKAGIYLIQVRAGDDGENYDYGYRIIRVEK